VNYRLVVEKPARLLRVGIDIGVDLDYFEGEFLGLWLIRPDGTEAGHVGLPALFYSEELFVPDPEVGSWTVRVVPFMARDAGPFRLRAKLEPFIKATPKPSKVSTLLPNLRMTPPFEFTLSTPAFVGAYGPLGSDVGPARGAAPTKGCLPVELVSYRARRCLRFSTGPENIGPGRLRISFRPDGSSLEDGPAFQQLDRTNGTAIEVPAGRYTYHLEHGHYHHGGFAGFTLLRADMAKRRLTPVGAGPKQGFCIEGQKIAVWSSFANERRLAVEQNCLNTGTLPTEESHMGISRGWADNYVYSQEGMFVDFGDNPDGYYVVRVRANARDAMKETTTRDNYSYAFVRIQGDTVRVLERGYGASPWDRSKRTVRDLLPLTAEA
jgi:hypothetical protein